MGNVRLGTITQNIIEFFVYDNEDKQCGSIYYAKSESDNIISDETIGHIPINIQNNLYRLRRIAEKVLKN